LTPPGTCIKLKVAMLASLLAKVLRAARNLERRWRLAAGFLVAALAGAILALAHGSAERARFLYFPRDWSYRFVQAESPVRPGGEAHSQAVGSVGGGALAVMPLDMKYYVAREGDTLSGIAERLGLDLDTVASLNRRWGSGVHLVRVGEKVLVPNQDGIFLAVEGSLEKSCAARGVPVEAVLAVNRVQPSEARPGKQLFFPGVQHTGIERSVVIGTAFLRPLLGWTSSRYGFRVDPFTGATQFHPGIDISAPLGTSVRAALDGKVAIVSRDPALGLYVLIRHQIGYSTLYGHLLQVFVKPGDAVTRGQRIGQVGSSGKSTGPHLHFEVRRSGRPINTTGLLSTRR
jgi:murein DD-endopeptidase MepM/ murein hydrolase activator NlpD